MLAFYFLNFNSYESCKVYQSQGEIKNFHVLSCRAAYLAPHSIMIPHYMAPHYAPPHYMAPHYASPHYMAPHYLVAYHTAPHKK